MARITRLFPRFNRDPQPRPGFFFGESDFLLRRHDYKVNIVGGFSAAQLTSNYATANGIHFPTRRRAYTRGSDRRPIQDMLIVSIDFSEVRFE